ncbi:hypothetical protein AcV7_005494 [Taiwanofungus camphoratus]|nr:hypothetical protein AcV7_005494 [Antrodia cinnamomea]
MIQQKKVLKGSTAKTNTLTTTAQEIHGDRIAVKTAATNMEEIGIQEAAQILATPETIQTNTASSPLALVGGSNSVAAVSSNVLVTPIFEHTRPSAKRKGTNEAHNPAKKKRKVVKSAPHAVRSPVASGSGTRSRAHSPLPGPISGPASNSEYSCLTSEFQILNYTHPADSSSVCLKF